MNRGSQRRLRLDGKLSADQGQPFSHADEAKSMACGRHLRVKAFSKIADGEMNLVLGCPQVRFIIPHTAVLCRIAKRFLQNSVEAKRNITRQRAWQIAAPETNLHPLLLAELLTESLHGPDHTLQVKPGRVQSVRQRLNVSG